MQGVGLRYLACVAYVQAACALVPVWRASEADASNDLRPLLAALEDDGVSKILPDDAVQSSSETCAASYSMTFNGTGVLERDRLVSKAKACVADERLLFLHIPKNVGTTIEDVAKAKGINWGRFMDIRDCHLDDGKCYVHWHEPPALMAAINMYTKAKVFCVVRNPFERVVSEYKYINKHPEYRWDYNDLVEREGCSSRGLNLWLASVLNGYLNGDIYQQLCHLLPQVYYIWGPPDTWGNQCQYCDEILRQEHFPGAFNNLMQRYDYDLRLSKHDHHNAGGCQNLSPKDLSSSNVELVQQIYANDFRWLHYPTEVP